MGLRGFGNVLQLCDPRGCLALRCMRWGLGWLARCWFAGRCSLAHPLLAAYSCLLAHFRREEARRLFLYMAKRKARGVSHGTALNE